MKGADGKPVQGAKISIVRTDIKGNYPTKTDKKGHYIYMGLPMGKYDVKVEIDGKMVDQQKGVANASWRPHTGQFRFEGRVTSKTPPSRRRCKRPSSRARSPTT